MAGEETPRSRDTAGEPSLPGAAPLSMELTDDARDEAAAAGLELTAALGLSGVPSPAPAAPDPGAALEPPPDSTAGDDLGDDVRRRSTSPTYPTVDRRARRGGLHRRRLHRRRWPACPTTPTCAWPTGTARAGGAWATASTRRCTRSPSWATTCTSAASSTAAGGTSRPTGWRAGTARRGRRSRAASAPAGPGSRRPCARSPPTARRLYVAGTFDAVGAASGAVAANGFAALDLATGDVGDLRRRAVVPGRPGRGPRAGARRRAALRGRLVRSRGRRGDRLARRAGPGHRRVGGRSAPACAAATSPARSTASPSTRPRARCYIGGSFTAAGDVTTSGVATLTDGEFGSLGAFTYYGEPGGANVIALAHAGGRLYAAGRVHRGGRRRRRTSGRCTTAAGWSVPAAARQRGRGAGRLRRRGGGRRPVRLLRARCGSRTPASGPARAGRRSGRASRTTRTPTALRVRARRDGRRRLRGRLLRPGRARAGRRRWRSGGTAHGTTWPAACSRRMRSARSTPCCGSARDLYVTGHVRDGRRRPGGEHRALGRHAVVAARQRHPGHRPALAMLGGKLYVGGGLLPRRRRAGLQRRLLGSGDGDLERGGQRAGLRRQRPRARRPARPLPRRRRPLQQALRRPLPGERPQQPRRSSTRTRRRIPPNPWAGYSRLPGVTASWMPGSRPRAAGAGERPVRGRHVHRRRRGVVDRSARPGLPRLNLAVWHFTAGDEAPGRRPAAPTSTSRPSPRSTGARSSSAAGSAPRATIAACGVAEHDPATGAWTAYGSGIGWGARGGRMVQALAQSPAAGLWVGGTFTVAGGAPSCGLALWRGTAGRAP